MRRTTTLLAVALTLLGAVALTGCACGGPSVEIVDMRTESFEVPTDDADSAIIELDLGIGELSITGGSSSLCAGEFRYNVAEWSPLVESRSSEGTTTVRITQPNTERRTIGEKARCYWTLELSEDIPADLVIDVGVGESTLDLGDAMVKRVDVDAGVGEVTIDASDVRRDLDIRVDAGVGSVVVFVPEEIGVRVDCDRGIGSFNATGLTRSHGGYVNAAYGETDLEITVRVDAGVGDIRVISGERTASI